MTKKRKIYTTYKQLSEAFKCGELDKNLYFIMLDKGGTENSFCYRGRKGESEKEFDLKSEECREIFQPGDEEIESLFEALEIPAEWC
jgi:hypothetical protein